MEMLSAWGAYTGSVHKWLEALLANGKIDMNDTVCQGPDGSYGVGEPTLEEEDDLATMDMVEVGMVSEWLREEIES